MNIKKALNQCSIKEHLTAKIHNQPEEMTKVLGQHGRLPKINSNLKILLR